MGSIHRNTYIIGLSSLILLSASGLEWTFFAGQITGVEGYVESAAMGLIAGISVHVERHIRAFLPPGDTCVGALLNYITKNC